MKKEILRILRCPECKGELVLINEKIQEREIKEGQLSCHCKKSYPIYNYIPRFIDSDKYVNSFSFEWKKHRKTQLDSANKNLKMAGQSRKDFEKRINFPLSDLRSRLILDIGCGMGRFSEIAVDEGANLVGVDLSYAVDIALENVGLKKNAHFIQADIFNLPFKEEVFDFIYSFGVFHHTPDCQKAFDKVIPFLKREGRLSIFVYSSYNKGIVYMSNFWRLFTTRLPKRLLYALSFISVPLYFLYKIPGLGNIGKMFFTIPMWPDWRWRVLDTFDWYSSKFQSKHTHWEVFNWFRKNGFKDIQIFDGEISMQGTKV
jgi:SAM-dependent methyltransferase